MQTKASLTSLMKAREQERKRLADLERAAMVALPQQFGFKSAEAFLWAFRAATGLLPRGSQKRGRFTPAMMEEFRERTAAGQTAQQIATALGIATQTVRNKWSLLEMKRRR